MSTVDAALAARRAALVTALHDHPSLRDKLSHAEIVTAVDQAFDTAAIPALLNGMVAAEQVVAAVQADVADPPASVTTAINDSYTPARGDTQSAYPELYNEP